MDVGGTLRGEVENEVGDLSKFAAAPERCGLRTRISLAQFVDADAARVGKRLFVSKGAKPRRLENAGGDTDDTLVRDAVVNGDLRVSDAVAVVDDEARPAREAGIIRTDAGEAGRELAAWLVENKLV